MGWLCISILALLLITAGVIQIPAVQHRLVSEAVEFLQKKIKTEVRLERISLSFPDHIVLTGLYLEDETKDTLLYVNRLEVNANLWGIARRNIHVQSLELDQLHAQVSRSRNDSTFNFNYIITAFSDTVSVKTELPSKDSSTSWIFSLDELILSKSKIAFHDEYAGNVIDLNIGELNIDMNAFNLNHAVFKADNILLHNADIKISQRGDSTSSTEKAETATVSSTPFPTIGFDEIDLKNIRLTYAQGSDKTLHVVLGEALLEADEIDLNRQVITLDGISLSNSFISFQTSSEKNEKEDRVSDESPSNDWKIAVGEINLLRNTIQYYDFSQPEQSEGFDAHHIWLRDLNLKANDIAFGNNNLNAEVQNLTVQDKKGFVIHALRTSIALVDDNLKVSDFFFQTANSNLSFDLSAKFNSLDNISESYPNTFVKLDMRESSIAWKDVLYFNPHLLDSVSLKIPTTGVVQVLAQCEGYLHDVSIETLSVKAFRQTQLLASGNITGLPDTKKMRLDVTLQKFHTIREDIESIVPDSLMATIRLPEWMDVNAHVIGSLYSPTVDASLKSSYGGITTVFTMDSTAGNEKYNGKVSIDEFELGKLLKKEDEMGTLDMQASVAGSGFTLENVDAAVNVLVNHIQYKGYDYHDFKADGTLKKYLFSGTAGIKDENLEFSLKGDVDYTADTVSYKLSLQVVNADLQALHLSEGQLKTRGSIDVDLATPDFKILNGDLAIRDFAVFNGSTLYSVDSLMVVSIDQQGKSELTIASDIISGEFKGTLNIFSLPTVVKQHFSRYFGENKSEQTSPHEEQNFKFNLVIHNTDLLTEVFIPQLEPFIPGEISGEFNSIENKLDLRLELARIRYAGVGTDSLRFNITSDDDRLRYNFSLRDIKADTLQVEALRIYGSVAGDSILNTFAILDRDLKEKYHIQGIVSQVKSGYQFHLLPGEMILNNEEWDVPKDNYLQFLSSGLRPHNFRISKGKEKIELSRTEDRDSLVSIFFTDLNLENITSLVEGTAPAKGIVNGDLNISFSEGGAFNSDLYIKEFELFRQNWGDLSFALGQTRTGPLNFDLKVEGEDVMIHTDGYYTSEAAKPEIHLQAEISKFNLAVAEPLTLGQLKKVSGQLTGAVSMNGVASDPDISGKISFNNATFTPAIANSEFTLKNETILVEKSGLKVNNFKITDRRNKTATVDGSIIPASFGEFKLDLTFDADDFQILNSTENDSKMFYGDVRMNTHVRIRGTSRLPVIDVQASLSDDSDFTYIIPQSQKGVLEQKGIVVFVDRDAKQDPFLASLNLRDTVRSSFSGIDLTANIELSDAETFNIIIDPITGDKLSVKGNATLTLNIDASGDMSLSGRYEISEGAYDLSFYKLVKRNFTIEKGSTITWSGDPLNGVIDIHALYQVETSALDLVSNQINSGNQQEMNMYRQRLPFEVYLIMKGELLTPDISFRLDMPENKQNVFGGNVYAKIRDLNTRESDLNKQVFSLLVLKRFIADNPFQSQGNDFSTTARTSVSRLLTEQLNRLSENVKGIELSFDVKSYEDYSSGQAQGDTEVQLGVTKNLFDERLIVKVSGNIDVEGGDAQQRQHSVSDYIGDLALEYKLTPDGRFRVTGFRNSNYDMIDGELIETGAGLIYIKDYNTLRELFKSNAKEK